MSELHIDSFSGEVADLTKTEQRYPYKVLAVLAKSPLVSDWDLSESKNLRRSIRILLDAGMVEELSEPYPWYRFQLTEKGNEKTRPQ